MTPVEHFASDYFVRERISPERRDDTLHTLRMLEDFAGAPVEQLDERHVADFVTHLAARGLHPNTVRWRLNMVKPFYGWAWERRIIDADRLMRIRKVKPPRGATGQGKPRPYKRTEIAQFWGELDARWPLAPDTRLRRFETGVARYRRVYTHAFHLMTEAAVSFALYGGLRVSEVYALSIDAMHPDNDFLVVHGKTEVWEDPKLREVPYTDAGRKATERWLAFRALLKPDHDRPWMTLRPCPTVLQPATHDTFKRLPGMIGDWEWHRFRHTCATEWLRAGMPIEEVQVLLGHANLSQTLVYAEIARGDVQKRVERHQRKFMAAVGHPSERLEA